MFRLKYIILIVLILLSSIGALYAKTNNAVVLMYHRFGENLYPSTNIRVEQFKAQLDYLKNNGYSIWPLERLVKYFQSSEVIPDKIVAITIDDAYRSVYEVAYPILKERQIPFTLFVATDPIDKKFANYMTWSQLKELVENDVTLGNHSRSHEHLVESKDGESNAKRLGRVIDEIKFAEKRISEETGVKPKLFAYPYGEYDLDLANELKKLNYIAFGQQSGPIGPASNFGYLPRFPISENYSDIKEFALKVASLSMPIKEIQPLEAVTQKQMPTLRISLATKIPNRESLHCYISGQGLASIQWLSEIDFIVRPNKTIDIRRSRYNCTFPSSKAGRYYWYSHLWIRADIPEP